MNIKEIARLAEVSVSTVSKIINRKDKNISQETRERVLAIVKEYHYTPYAGVQVDPRQKSLLIALLLNSGLEHTAFAMEVVEQARKLGYGTILCRSSTPEEELKNVNVVCSHRVDGVLWDKLEHSDPQCSALLEKKGIPVVSTDFFSPVGRGNPTIDYEALGYQGANILLELGHTQIFCVVDQQGALQTKFYQGVQRRLLEAKLPLDDQLLCQPETQGGEVPNRYCFHYTGAICFSQGLAIRLREQLERKNRRVPKYLSILCLESPNPGSGVGPALSSLPLPYHRLAADLCQRLAARMENKPGLQTPFSSQVTLTGNHTLDIPFSLGKHKIVVVGAINMDTILSLSTFPKTGETTLAASIIRFPGGKGLNQAVGVTKLGAEAYLIGMVGKDYEGSELFDFLKSAEISTQGVSHTSKLATGQAYIHTQSDGESGIVIYDGANRLLSSKDITNNIHAFANAGFCLLQTEIDLDAVEYAARAARSEGAKIILKPAAISSIPDSLVEKAFVFLPNEKELEHLCPGEAPLEEKASVFLKKGATHVIITLGKRGCYWKSEADSQYFPGAAFHTVDTTGAADAFAAALAVSLSRDLPMERAIRLANYAAGFSTTTWGVPGALIDKTTLELYLSSESQ